MTITETNTDCPRLKIERDGNAVMKTASVALDPKGWMFVEESRSRAQGDVLICFNAEEMRAIRDFLNKHFPKEPDFPETQTHKGIVVCPHPYCSFSRDIEAADLPCLRPREIVCPKCHRKFELTIQDGESGNWGYDLCVATTRKK